jgi:hypothetical protein
LDEVLLLSVMPAQGKSLAQEIPWFVILLFDSSETGFILTYDDVRNYIRNIWPLGADGDYKPATGTYLSDNSPFYFIDLLIEQIQSHLAI